MSNIRLLRNMLLNLLERNKIKKRLKMRYPDEIYNDISNFNYVEDFPYPTNREFDKNELDFLESNKFVNPLDYDIGRSHDFDINEMKPKNYLSELEQDIERAEKLGVLDEFLKAKEKRKYQENINFDDLDDIPF